MGHDDRTNPMPHRIPHGLRRWSGKPRLLQGEPVTQDMPLYDSLRRTPYRDPRVREEPDEFAERRRRLDLAVRVGELLLRGGAGTREVESSVIAVAASMGLRRLEVDITNQSLLVQCPSPSGEPLTALRVVRSSTRDFARLTAVHDLVDRIVHGDVDMAGALGQLKEIQRRPRLYPRWVVTLGAGGLAGSVSGLLGAGIFAIVVSVFSAVVIDRVGRLLSRRDLPDFYLYAVGGAIATLLSWLAFAASASGWVDWQMSTNDFAYAVAGGIVVQLPGRSMTSAVEDAVTGYPVTGAARLLVTALAGAGLIVGVAVALSATLRLESALGLQVGEPDVALTFTTQETLLWLVAVCGAVGATSSALTMRSRPRMVAASAVLGVVGVLSVQVFTRYLGLGATTAVALAAVLVGLGGRVGGVRLGAPALVLVAPAVSPLLPGLRIFQGMYDVVSGIVLGTANAQDSGITTLVGAAGVALAISTGIVLGDVMGARFDTSSVRRRRRARRR